MEYKLLTGRENLYLAQYKNHLIHKDCLEDLKRLQLLAKKEIGADLEILSSFRDFSRQELIWNNKAKGLRDLYDSEGSLLVYDDLTKEELLRSILRWSAIPGASRHHWGCDIDIFDKNKIEAQKVQLLPSESAPGGAMFDLHKWLGEKILNKESFGFFRPYDQDFGGINIEKWHLSYSPVSSLLLNSYSIDLFIQNLEESSIELKGLILENVEDIFQLYIKTITLY